MGDRKEIVDERGSNRGPEYRHRTPWILKWWPVLFGTVAMVMSATGFYYGQLNTDKTVAENKEQIEEHSRYSAQTYVSRSEMLLQLHPYTIQIDALRQQIVEYKRDTDGHYIRLDKKLDRVIEQLGQLQTRNRGE